MTGLVGGVFRAACTLLVLGYSLRRILFLHASACRSARTSDGEDALPTLAIVVACRDEAGTVEPLLDALDEIDYPADSLTCVVVDDGSADGTGELLARWAEAGTGRIVVRQPAMLGKVRALEAGAAAASSSELVGVCDADQRPRVDCWRLLAVKFADERVGAVSGFLRPANHDASAVSRYAALESWVHQLVTAEGKSRLGLNPPTLGGGAIYRRTALKDVGGFVAGISGEDVTTSVALTEAGWTTTFVRDAVVDNTVVARWSDYWHQHLRWARGTLDTTGEFRRDSRATGWRRVESRFVSAGYLDRLGFLGSCLLASQRPRSVWLPALYVAVAGAEAGTALARGGVSAKAAPRYLASLAIVFPVDVLATGVAVLAHLRRDRPEWRSPR